MLVVLWTFRVDWFNNRIDVLVFPVTFHVCLSTVLLVLLLLLHDFFRPTLSLTSGGIQCVRSLSGPSAAHILLLLFLRN